MNNASPSLKDFVRGLEEEIEESNRNGGGFSVLVLSAARGLFAEERRKVFEWGEAVLRNHAPEGAIFAADADSHTCLMLVPRLEAEAAESAASYFGGQLNKLPVYGMAPGGGWAWDYACYPQHADGIESLRARLTGTA
ncbi:MAG TPA: hypothetical protein VH951_10435 [Dehalococcoidia bacterium]